MSLIPKLALAVFAAVAMAGVPGNQAIASDDPAEIHDMPGFGVWGPAYRLRNVPEGMMLKVRMSPDRSSRTSGVLRRTATEILVLRCTPEIDSVAYDRADRAGKHAMLSTSWCLIERGQEGYIPGVYLDPILNR